MSIYIESRGQGRDLVLLHGWGMNGAVFETFATELTSFCRVHVVDLPGYGHSQPVAEAHLELDVLVAQLSAALPQNAILMGWSLGGMLAWQMALSAPQRWAGVITMASSPRFVATEGWPGVAPSVLQGFARSLQQDSSRTVERFLAIQAMGSPSAREDALRMKDRLACRPAPTPAALTAGLALLNSLDLRTQLSSLSIPMLSLFGRLDALVPVAVMEQSCWQRPHLQTICLTASAHAPFLTEPEAVYHLVQQFMSRLSVL